MAQLVGGGDGVANCNRKNRKSNGANERSIGPSGSPNERSIALDGSPRRDSGNTGELEIHPEHDEANEEFLQVPEGPYCEALVLSTFPWVVLSVSESQLISQNAENLLSEDLRDAEESCHVFLDVLLHDFPAEIFLQRPAVIQGLFGFLESKNAALSLPAFSSIQDLTKKFALRFHQSSRCPSVDGEYFHGQSNGDCSISVVHLSEKSQSCAGSSLSSILSSRSTLSRSPGNGSSSSSDSARQALLYDSVEMETPEETLKLQLRQIPFPVYLCAVIDACLNVLGEEIPFGIANPLQLLDLSARLLRSVVRASIWTTESADAQKMAENLLHSLQAVGNRIMFHAKRTERIFEEARLSRLIYAGLCKTVFILIDLVPLSHIKNIPGSFRACLPLICQDEALALAFPVIREKLLPYLKASHTSGYEVFRQAKFVCSAMTNACHLMQDTVDSPSCTYHSDAEKAIHALPSLVYHQSGLFFYKCFQLCSDALSRTQENSEPFTTLLIRLISYPNCGVQKQAYQILWNFCAATLNVKAAADPTRTPGYDVIFLTFKPVLREIILYGLFQPDTKVFAQNILSLLSQKFLINNASVWNRLRSAIKTLFCGVFVHADLDSDFGRRVFSWSQDQEEENALFDDTTRCRAAYSLMFHHNRLVRGHASELLLRRIGGIRLHGDSLMSESQYVFEVDNTELFCPEVMERGVKVWMDSRLDIAVRWTALRQVYLQLQRPVAQESFVWSKGPQSLFTMLKLIADGTEKDWSVENIGLLLDCILAVVFHNDKWRSENCRDLKLYDCVVSALSLVHTGSALWSKVQSTGATVIFLLSYADVLLRKEGALSVCSTFYRSVLFPFNIIFHNFNKKEGKGATCDLLRSPVADMLVLHWNVSLAGDVDRFLAAENRDDWQTDFAPRLVMDDGARNLVRVMHPHHGFISACREVESAKNHGQAVKALDAMSVYLLLWPFLSKEKIAKIPSGVESCFRYMSVLPHNASDLNLLRNVAKFVTSAAESYMAVGKYGPLPEWVSSLVFDQESLFLEAVRKANKELTLLASGRASLRVAYIVACKTFVTTAWQLFGIVPSVIGGDESDFLELLDLFVETLRNILMSPSVDFGRLGLVCRSISKYCGLASVAKQPETISFVPVLITTLQVVHQKQRDATCSFTGRSITQSAALALTTLVTYQVENQLFPAMLESWKDENGTLSWLIPLWADRDSLIRSAGLSISTALSQTKEGRSLLISCFMFVPGGVWSCALSFLFSPDEPDLVKHNAVNLLSALLKSDLKRADLVLRHDVKNVDLETTDALCAMLEQLGFYRAVLRICQNFDGTRRARLPAEYLLASIFNLCATLVKLVGRRAVVRLKELKFFHSALHVCFLVKVFIQNSPKLFDRLEMFRDLFGFLGQAVQVDETVAEIVAHNMHAVGAALCLLDPAIAPVHEEMTDLWTNIYICLSECLQTKLVLDSVWRLLSENHRTIYANTKTSLNLLINHPDNRRLQVALLTVLEVITETDRSEVQQFLWQPVAGPAISPAKPHSIGALLTNFLVQKFSEPTALQVDAWVELLKRLLRHEQVRALAMDCGLMETVMDMLLEMDSTISRDIHVHSRNVLKKKMSEPLRMCMELLMNLMFRNTKGKQLAAQRSLASVLISLWITIIQDTESLHILFLKLLCTFGARCQDALASFVKESEHHHTAPLTLFHVVIADLEEQLAQPLPHPDITPLLFDIVGQMSLNPLCRVFIRKSISVKRSMLIPSPRKPKVLQAIDAMWLHVLANLSFFEDGQVVILSKEDICTILFDYLEIEGLFPEIYSSSMLILRNLAFCQKGMVRLSGARGVLARLVRLSSSHPDPKVRLYALSCLLELLYDQVKLRHAAKVICFDDFGQGKPDDEARMFDLRARLFACLDTEKAAIEHDDIS